MRRTVMVVHPDPDSSMRIAALVEASGHDALLVPDGERAIDRFIQSPVDAMVVEMVLPGRDGATTVESVRWAPGGDEVAVILLGTRGTGPAKLDEAGNRVRALATLGGPLNEAALASLLAGLALPETAETRVASADEVQAPLRETSEHFAFDATTSAGSRAAFADVTTSPEVPPSPLDPDPTGFEEEMLTDVDEPYQEWPVGHDETAQREGRAVERQARELDRTRDVLSGDLATTPFPRLLHEIAEARATGGLVLESERDQRRTTTGESPKKVVFFRNGVPMYVQSNLVQECLGQVLARGGHISHGVLEESIRRMRSGEGRQGAVLLHMGAISPHGLRDALEDQLRVKLFDLFAWAKGEYHFSEEVPTPAEIVTLEMSLGAIVMRGVVHRIPPQRLLQHLQPHLQRYVVPQLERMERFRSVQMAPEARRVLHTLDGTERLRELLSRAGNRPGAAAQLLYSLHCLDAVSFEPEARETTRLAESDEEVGHSVVTRDIAVLREELGRLGRLLREERYAEALRVEPGDAEAAQRSAARLAARYRPATEAGAAPRDLRALAYEVCARLVHAERAMSKPRAGESRPDAFAEVPTRDQKGRRNNSRDGSMDSDAGLADSDATRTGRRREALPADERVTAGPKSDSVVELATGDLFEDDEATEEDRPPKPRAGDDLAAPAPDAAALGSDPAARDSAAPGRHPAARDSAAFDSAALDERVRKLYQAERHFRRGDRALKRGRLEEAVTSFSKAVELCPDEGEFLAHLGYARYQLANGDETTAVRAIEDLTRSCVLAPKLDLTHLLRARVLRDLGELEGARDAYEQALSANPDCAEALDGLQALSG